MRSGSGKEPIAARTTLDHYRIEVEFGNEFSLSIRAEAQVRGPQPSARVIELDLSDRVTVSNVEVEGAPLEFFHQRTPALSGGFQGTAGKIVILLSSPVETREEPRVEIRYSCKLVSDAGAGVYYVTNRDASYPRGALGFSD